MKNKSNKPLRQFALKARGYDVSSVEAYIALKDAECAEAQRQYAVAADKLKADNDALRARIADFERRENQINNALTAAQAKAEELMTETRLRCAMEAERVRMFRSKWTAAYDELKSRYGFDKDALNVENVALNAEVELKQMLATDFPLGRARAESGVEAQFRSECNRLGGEEVFSQIAELKSRLMQATAK